jgi:hypothetical protein
MPATLNYTKGSAAALPAAALDKLFVLHNVIDFAKTASGAGDTVQVLHIPAGTLVLRAGYHTRTLEGGTATGTLGDGTDPDGFLTATNWNSTTDQLSSLLLTEAGPNTVTAYTGGKYYAAADTIDAVTTEALDKAVVDFYAICISTN